MTVGNPFNKQSTKVYTVHLGTSLSFLKTYLTSKYITLYLSLGEYNWQCVVKVKADGD